MEREEGQGPYSSLGGGKSSLYNYVDHVRNVRMRVAL